MVVTVTINPLLEKYLSYPAVQAGAHHRNPEVVFKSGGKGVNVSRQLKHLGIHSTAMLFLGGDRGRHLKKIIDAEGIETVPVRSKSETRLATIAEDRREKKLYTFFEENPVISEVEAQEFCDRLDKVIANSEIMVFSGSSPSPAADIIFPYGIRRTIEEGKVAIVDTYGAHLQACIDAAPTILHANQQELQNSLGVSLESDEEYAEVMAMLYSKGVKQSFITNGKETGYASQFDYHYRFMNPVVEQLDATGSGDAFLSGIIHGWYHDNPFDEFLPLAMALGAVNATSLEVCRVQYEEAGKLLQRCRIEPFGKKMRLVDVTPTA